MQTQLVRLFYAFAWDMKPWFGLKSGLGLENLIEGAFINGGLLTCYHLLINFMMTSFQSKN